MFQRRTKTCMYLFLFSLVCFIQSVSSKEEISNSGRGLKYARMNCSSCHGVLKEDLRSPNPGATPFVTIANTPGITRISLGVFLQTSHPTMPNLIIKDEDAESLISYILSLKKQPR